MQIIDRPQSVTTPASSMLASDAGLPSAPSAKLITQLLTLVRRRYVTILAVTGAALLVGVTYALLTTKQYAAEALVEIKRENESLVSVGASQSQQMIVDQEFYETQYGLLRSQSLAERVASDLRLYDNREFFKEFGALDSDWSQGERFLPTSRASRIRSAGSVLLKHISVSSERLSRLVRLRFVSPDPMLSKRVVDAWAQGFIKTTLERRYEATSYARNFLEGRLSQLRQRINESERELVRYAGEQGIVNLPGVAGGSNAAGTHERSLADTDLETLNEELAKATADRISAQSRRNTPAEQASESLTNQAISLLRQERATRAADYAKLMTQFEPDYPPAKQVKAQIDQLDRSIAVEEHRISGTIDKTYQAALARENLLQTRVQSLKSGVLDNRRRSIQYNIYLRDVDTNRQLYDALLQRYKEIGVAGGVGSNNISIVDNAELPLKPTWPNTLIILFGAIFGGAVLGFGIALLQEQLDNAISDPQQVPDELGVPLLGTIPTVRRDIRPADELRDRKSAITEAYNSTRMALSLAREHGFPKVISVTSTRASEGTTTTSYALASLLARSLNRVLLVDGDMRRPSVHSLFGIANQAGLSNFLAGEDLKDLIRTTDIPGLQIITAGPNPPSAPDLLETDRLATLIAEMKKHFDYIIIDAPPLLGLADAPLIGSQVEGVVFVVQAHSSQKNMAQIAISRLRAANVSILGVVLTKFDLRKADYGYSYSYGYSYGNEDASGKNAA